MNLGTSIGLVTGGLSLVAFVVAALLYAYQSKLRNRQQIIASVGESDRIKAIDATADYLRIDVSNLSGAAKERLVLEELRRRKRRELLLFIAFIIVAILLTLVAFVALVGGNSTQDRREFSVVGDRVNFGCKRNAESRAGYTADANFHIQTVNATPHEFNAAKSASARVTSNDGRSVAGSAYFRGRDTNWVGNCPGGGSGQVRLYGTIEKDMGLISLLYVQLLKFLNLF